MKTICIFVLIIVLAPLPALAGAIMPAGENENRVYKAYGETGLKIYREMDGIKQAKDIMERAGLNEAERAEMLKWFEKEAGSLNQTALGFWSAGRPKEAIPYIEMAIEITSRVLGKDHPAVANAVNFLAGLYKETGREAEAEPLYKWALEISEKRYGKDHPSVAAGLINLALLYKSEALYKEAEPLLKRALEICRTSYGPDHPSVAAVTANLALLYDAEGRYEDAEPLYRKALEMDEKALGAGHPQLITGLNNLALLYHATGRYADAEPLLRRAIKIIESTYGAGHPQLITGLNNLALLYHAIGRYADAEPLFKRALEMDEKAFGAGHINVASDLNNLAGLYKETGRSLEAEALYERALMIAEKTPGATETMATSLNNLAVLYDETGRLSKAENLYKQYKQALEINERLYGKDHPQLSTPLNNLGLLYYAKGRYADAEPLFKRAITIGQNTLGKDHPDVAVWMYNLALLYAATGRHAEGHRLFIEATAIEDKKRENVFTFLSEKQKLHYMKRTEGSIYAFLNHSARYQDSDGVTASHALNAWLRWKGAVLEAQGRYMEALMQSDNPEIKEKFAELISVRRQLAKLQGRGTASDYRKRLDALEREKQELEEGLSRLSKDFSLEAMAGKADTSKIASLLPLDAVYIDFANIYSYDFSKKTQGKQHYFVFVLSGRDNPIVKLIDLGEAEKIDNHINAFLEEMKSPIIFGELPNEETLKADAAALYNALIKPIEASVRGKKKLYLSPDGNLSLMPFEVLTSPEGKYLIEDYLISYITAGRDIIRFADTTPPKNTVLIMADPDYDLRISPKTEGKGGLSEEASALSFQRLPDTKDEAGEIEKTLRLGYKDRVFNYQDKKALEEVLMSTETPGILHLATHGYFLRDVETKQEGERLGLLSGGGIKELRSENPMLRSGIVLAGANTSIREGRDDGIVNAEKILGLKLKGTELVVLSACDTGSGDVKKGEGVFGLKRAFILAGAKTLVMSLWSVPSKETKDLMTDFYSMMAKGKGKAEALREAKLKIMKQRPNPFFWAAFVLTGRP